LRVLCLGAHSDDIEIGCGATMLELMGARPVDVTWVVFSGNADREREARKGAKLFLSGANRADVVVQKFRDGFFPFVGADIKEFFETLAETAPDVIFTHFRDDRHQDHRLISDLTWNTFRNHTVLEYEIPKYDGDLARPNLFVPVSSANAARKVRYLRSAFATQRDRHWFADETFMGLMRVRGLECRAPQRYAEAFHSRKAVLDLTADTRPAPRARRRVAR
jgi:LmbE family N-acetylglucosaminyl deacetylase